jgi:hypothetical protein
MVAGTDWGEWTALGTLAAAGATVLLAGVTVWLVVTTRSLVSGESAELAATKNLAEQTRDLAASTKEQAEIAARALELQLEPRLVPVHDAPPHALARIEIGGIWAQPIDIAIQNAGSGVAELTRVEVSFGALGHADRIAFPGVLSAGITAKVRGPS